MGETKKKYDLIVIGSGAGLTVANFAIRQLGWKVALCEDGPLGGTCLNRGCIPSKLLIHPADVIEEIRQAKRLGIDASITQIDFAQIMRHMVEHVDPSSEKIRLAAEGNSSLDLYTDSARFIDNHTLDCGGQLITSDRIVIAAGARPAKPPIPGLESVDALTSTEALRLEKLPASMVIIGGGYIAAELGHFYGALGCEITVVEAAPLLLAREDEAIAAAFTQDFSKKYQVYTNSLATSVEQDEAAVSVLVTENSTGKTTTVTAETLLVAAGIRPNSDLLKLDRTDIELDKRGNVVTNAFLETNVPGVWALGDINGVAPFRHAANWQANHLVRYLQGDKSQPLDYSVMPHAIFTSPQIAGVGLTEQEAKAAGMTYEVKRQEFTGTAMGVAMEATGSFVKYILDPGEQRILGCHIYGPQASILIHEIVVAMSAAGGKISAIKNAIHIHPALSEVMRWPL